MPDRFSVALGFVLPWEGGFVDDPHDRGGRTQRGVTQGTYDAWRGAHGLGPKDVKDLSDAELQAIYRAGYWERAHCADLPAPLDVAQFDAAVQHGPGNAVRFLQRALGFTGADVDGAWGHDTAAAVAAADPATLLPACMDRREAFYRAIVAHDATQGRFLKGWLNRLGSLRTFVGAGHQEGILEEVPDGVVPSALTPALRWEDPDAGGPVPLVADVHELPTRSGRGLESVAIDLTGLTGLNVRLEEVTVLDLDRGFFDFSDEADVYPLFVVVAGAGTPMTLQALRVYEHIRAGDRLPIASGGEPTIYRSADVLPPWVDVHLVLLRSRQKARDVATGITAALSSDEGKAIQAAALSALSAANPTAGMLGGLAVKLLNLACRFISQQKDDQLFYAWASIEEADGYALDRPLTLTDDRHASITLRVQGRR